MAEQLVNSSVLHDLAAGETVLDDQAFGSSEDQLLIALSRGNACLLPIPTQSTLAGEANSLSKLLPERRTGSA